MKKSIFAVLFLAIALIAAPAYAGCDGPNCVGFGGFVVGVDAADGAIDMGGTGTYNGMTGGIVAAGGAAEGLAAGGTIGGSTSADLGVVAGGRVKGGSYDYFNFGPGNIEHVIGSYAVSDAEVGGHIDVNTTGYVSAAAGGFHGIAGQGGAVVSAMGSAPIQNADFHTAGIAAQGSVGFIEGSAFTSCRYGKGAFAAGDIYMAGAVESYSYRGVSTGGDTRAEYAGTESFASTMVESYGSEDDDGRRNDADIDGGFIAGGVAANKTTVETENGAGKAFAGAAYLGAGKLNCNYNGSANAGTMVTTYTRTGMQGSIISSQAHASATSQMGNGQY